MAHLTANLHVREDDAIDSGMHEMDDGSAFYGRVTIGKLTIFVMESDTAARVAGAFSDLSALLLDREQKAARS